MKKGIIIGTVLLVIGSSLFFFRNKLFGKSKQNQSSGNGLNILIGDSQTPFVAKQSNKFQLLSKTGGIGSLWKGGENLKWLKNAVDNYDKRNDISNVGIVIGTNGAFSSNDNVDGLISSLKIKFPNAKLFVIQGSWGWGGNKSVTQSKVDSYYQKFRNNGVTIIEPAIGKVSDPHNNLSVYKTIANNLDSKI